jgi:hypothetical protein
VEFSPCCSPCIPVSQGSSPRHLQVGFTGLWFRFGQHPTSNNFFFHNLLVPLQHFNAIFQNAPYHALPTTRVGAILAAISLVMANFRERSSMTQYEAAPKYSGGPLPHLLSLKEAASPKENWTGLSDAAKRRKIQNRLNQRACSK